MPVAASRCGHDSASQAHVHHAYRTRKRARRAPRRNSNDTIHVAAAACPTGGPRYVARMRRRWCVPRVKSATVHGCDCMPRSRASVACVWTTATTMRCAPSATARPRRAVGVTCACRGGAEGRVRRHARESERERVCASAERGPRITRVLAAYAVYLQATHGVVRVSRDCCDQLGGLRAGFRSPCPRRTRVDLGDQSTVETCLGDQSTVESCLGDQSAVEACLVISRQSSRCLVRNRRA